MTSESAAGSILRGESDFGLPGVILAGLTRAMPCVCAIENAGSSNGTGLLIAPDLVLTNHHVVDRLLQPGAALDEAECRFDYVDAPGGGPTSRGVMVAIAEVGIAQSEPSPGDRLDGPNTFDPNKLDYAIIRLRKRMDKDLLPDGRQRGWFPLPARSLTLDAGSPLLLLQHPEGEGFTGPLQPLRSGQGIVLDVLADGRRFVHDATTRRGSSGSPCFSMEREFDIVALHNARRRLGADAQGPERQAVAIEWIVRHIQKTFRDRGRNADFIGVQPPARSAPKPPPPPDPDRVYNAALCLMDRFSEESVLAAPSDSFERPGVPMPRVHVFVSQERDLPEQFRERLKYVSFGGAASGRHEFWLQTLKAGLPLPSGGIATGPWPAQSLGETAKRERDLESRINNFDPSRQRALVLKRDVDLDWNPELERDLIERFAKRFAARFPDRPNLQAVVIFVVPDDAETLAAAFAGMWPATSPPPGIVCQRMTKVARDDLIDWCDYLDQVWGGSDAFRDAFERLPRRSMQPLKDVQAALAGSLKAYISEWLLRAPPGTGGAAG